MILILIYAIGVVYSLGKNDYKYTGKYKNMVLALIIISSLFLISQTGFILGKTNAIVAEIVLASMLIMVIYAWAIQISDISHIFNISKMYKTSPLSRNEENNIKNKIMDCLEKNQFYLNQDLKIKDISNAINIPAHHISQVLNERMEMSFHDLINLLRIEHAKVLILSGATEQYSIQAIGEESGYKNKSSFYRAFKKNTGTTPSKYKKIISSKS